MPQVSFDEVADLVAQFSGADRPRIAPSTRVESDLGITGGDGDELLQKRSARFGTDFSRPNHEGRFLFGSEGTAFPVQHIRRLFGHSRPTVVPITVGDLHLAVVRGRRECALNGRGDR